MTLVNKTFSQLITFTRASSATFVGSNGLIQTATTNTPRFDFDPVTLAAKGLLIEEQRTNLLRYSEEFDNAAWVKSRSSITANATVSPDGTSNADKLVEDTTASATHRVFQQVAKAASSVTRTFAVYLKAAERTFARVLVSNATESVVARADVNLSTGTITAASVAGGSSISAASSNITPAGNGWYRCSVTATFDADITNPGAFVFICDALSSISYTGNGTDGIFIWGAQWEDGSFATSYIPTVASQVTRSADVASVNTLSPWYNATEGTLYVEADAFINVTTTQVYNSASINDGTISNRHRMFIYNGSWGAAEVVGGVIQCDLKSFGSYTANVKAQSAFGYKVNDFALSVNGATALTDTSGSIITSVSRLSIGGSPADNYINGHIRRITYYKRRLSNADLQSITL